MRRLDEKEVPLPPPRPGGAVPVSCVLLAKAGGARDIVGYLGKERGL